jgi:CSLREA domain-containing protein
MSTPQRIHPFAQGATVPWLVFSLLLAAAMPARAIDITVDILGDPVPNDCTPGGCSLREAVTLANSLAGPDRIFLPATPNLPLQLSIPGDTDDANVTGDLDVLDDLEIIGTGVNTTTLVQIAADRVLQTQMDPDQRLVLRGLTIQGGSSAVGGALRSDSLVTIEDVTFVGNEVTNQGGAIYFAGFAAPSIAESRLVLRRVRFENNIATLGNNGFGGAVYAQSSLFNGPFLLIEDCEFIGNQADSAGGAILIRGNTTTNGGDVVVRRSQFSANSSGGRGGGAIYTFSSEFDLKIEDSLFDANTATTTGNATATGGAIYFESAGVADLLRTTFSSNSAPLGGAISHEMSVRLRESHFFDNEAALGGGAVWSDANLVVERSTFQSNNVTSTDSSDPGGGAIGFSADLLDVRRSTFAGNEAFRGGAISFVRGQMALYGSTLVGNTFGMVGRLGTVLRILDETAGNSLQVVNSIIIGTCSFSGAGRQLSLAYNNIEAPNASCRLDTATVSDGNQIAVSSAQVALGTLTDNGGPTLTRLPGAGSIALNQGLEAACTPTDQRNFQRADSSCDVGAVEVGATPQTDEFFRNGFE